MLVVFSCKFSVFHEFFIHREREKERERLRQKEGMIVDMKWLCTVPMLVWIFHAVSVSVFVFPPLCPTVSFMLNSVDLTGQTEIADVIEVSSFLVWPSLQTNPDVLTSVA